MLTLWNRFHLEPASAAGPDGTNGATDAEPRQGGADLVRNRARARGSALGTTRPLGGPDRKAKDWFMAYVIAQPCIGVKDAKRFLVKNLRFVTGMARSGGFYKPTGFVEALAPLLADPLAGVTGFHLYTFNAVEATEAWRRTMLDGPR